MNTVYLVGYLKTNPVYLNNECKLDIIIKNTREEVTCMCYGDLAQRVADYCDIDTLVSVKGRVDIIDGTMYIVAEQVSF